MRTVKNPNEIVNDLVADYAAAVGDSLVSVIMYGSAVTHEYDPRRSSIRILVVVASCDADTMDRLASAHKRWRRMSVPAPTVFARTELAESLDALPVELLDMKSSYRVLHGDDMLRDVQADREHLRLQCERQLRLVLLDLRTGMVELAGNDRLLRQLAESCAGRLMPLYKAILALEDTVVPTIRTQVIGSVEDLLGLGMSVLSQLGTGDMRTGAEEKVRALTAAVGCMVEYVDGARKQVPCEH